MYRENSELYKFAVKELDILLEEERKHNLTRPIEELEKEVELFKGKTPQESINDDILTLIKNVPEGYSGDSWNYLLCCFNRLVNFENLTPLTLADDEFEEVARDNDILYQNKRNFKVFKSTSKGIYHLDGPAALDDACGKYGEENE